ncbi:unnamed protein product [Clonostachys rosea f. rosea IK726]|uniref:Uncharacterized protein n=1 Tax=Clonostachys rosea f. rosea IK726 TaxID=1349383 RepID=A0ACA9UMR1_BIOOC|nr:unnamed protein product [Clonostachys rosea f. rosea IK726]
MPESQVSSSSILAVESSSSTLIDVVSKASGASWSEWDPGSQWSTRNEYKLAAQPQEGYCFPEYLGHDADCGPYRLGTVFSKPNDLDTILFVPKAVPDGCHVSVSGPDVLSESDEKFPLPPFPGPPATREFRFQRLENRLVSLTPGDLKRIVDHPPVNKILNRILVRRSVYIITGLKIVNDLEVSDGKFYRKFNCPVIFSYRMHKVQVTSHGLRKELVKKR